LFNDLYLTYNVCTRVAVS